MQLDGRLDPLLHALPEGAGGGPKLREFWVGFAALELRPLASRRTWVQDDFRVLEEVRKRCVHSTYPFAIALQLLQEGWHRSGEQLSPTNAKEREVATAAKTSAQWATLLAVQNVLGRLDLPARPFDEVQRDIRERHARYTEQARAFLLAGAMLKRVETAHRKVRAFGGAHLVATACVEEVTALLAVQHVIQRPLASWASESGTVPKARR